MAAMSNPALNAFVAEMGDEIVIAQVLIRRLPEGFELRHAEEQAVAPETLRTIDLSDLRRIATYTKSGAFRPLKSAPNLQTGWRVRAKEAAELDLALNQLYPGAIADWFAARAAHSVLTDWRAFTQRQTGMYRITEKLSNSQAARVIRTGCHARFCLKRRLWTGPGTPAEDSKDKSLIPCLEPCALLLELARKAMRIEQEEKIEIHLAPSEIETLVEELEKSIRGPHERPVRGREADLEDVRNPRRAQLILEKLREELDRSRSEPSEG